jgi:hypothetical protein
MTKEECLERARACASLATTADYRSRNALHEAERHWRLLADATKHQPLFERREVANDP